MKTVDRLFQQLEDCIRQNRFEDLETETNPFNKLEKAGMIRREGGKPRYEIVSSPTQLSLT